MVDLRCMATQSQYFSVLKSHFRAGGERQASGKKQKNKTQPETHLMRCFHPLQLPVHCLPLRPRKTAVTKWNQSCLRSFLMHCFGHSTYAVQINTELAFLLEAFGENE